MDERRGKMRRKMPHREFKTKKIRKKKGYIIMYPSVRLYPPPENKQTQGMALPKHSRNSLSLVK